MPPQVKVATLLLLALLPLSLVAQPHRIRCTSPQCRATRSWVKAHYCGESPYGNGPADSCDIVLPKHLSSGITRIADINCDTYDKANQPICRQTGNPPAAMKAALLEEMHHIGLPSSADGRVLYSALSTSPDGTLLTEAYYGHHAGTNLTECQVIAVISPDSHLTVLRKLPPQKTNADVYTTTWSALDIVTINGQQEFILAADAYEDHWFEAIILSHETPQTIFAGLGYFL